MRSHWEARAAHRNRHRPNAYWPSTRGHWSIDSVPYIIDWNDDEDRSQIRTGFGTESITRLRRFAVGTSQKPAQSIAEMMHKLRMI